MLAHCELANIRPVEFSGKRLEVGGEPVAAKVSSEVAFAVSRSFMANRLHWRVELADKEEVAVAELAAVFVVDYEVLDGFEPDEQAAEAIANSTGFFAAYPYARELFQSQTARLQLNPLVLGLLLQGASQPRAVTAVTLPSAPLDE
ncbi:hypothetical protein EV652_12266 [Kribbella steppae]|uniref:Preprotein translocase subunit SecB n=2 Tax=Kribbella steppae TaxID=2512223 RepID=A0A4R2GWK4_9ACTN|nr:hypothetical protein EV652_12266 [Kribbella steppae]